MRRNAVWRWLGAAASVAAVGLFAVSCTKESVVFVERPLFDDPPAAANGFLGYSSSSTEDTGFTVCGNCHIGQQAEWSDNAHASAWEGLQSSGGAQAFCESCHTTGPNGNESTEGGHDATADPRYYDVQCESCHGPGQGHVDNPDAFQPLASIAITDAADDFINCGDCHEGSHHPFAEEWSNSKHAEVVDFAAARPECEACHKGQGTLSAWGVTADYVEKDGAAQPTTCAVCHDPHNSTNEGQLRFPVNTNSYETHLCSRCHDRRTEPDPGSSHGLEPHSPETALLQGTAGWFPPSVNFNQDTIRGTHGSARNTKLCATCHVNMFTVTDEVTGDFVFQSTGHLFTAIPCVDAQGIPQPGPCPVTTTDRSWQGCTGSGCHADATVALTVLTVSKNRIDMRSAELLSQMTQVDPNLDAPGGEIDPTNPTFTVAEGAFFNYSLANFEGSSVGSTAHNPFLTESLLIASIQAMQDTYMVTPAFVDPTTDWDGEIRRILNRIGR